MYYSPYKLINQVNYHDILYSTFYCTILEQSSQCKQLSKVLNLVRLTSYFIVSDHFFKLLFRNIYNSSAAVCIFLEPLRSLDLVKKMKSLRILTIGLQSGCSSSNMDFPFVCNSKFFYSFYFFHKLFLSCLF